MTATIILIIVGAIAYCLIALAAIAFIHACELGQRDLDRTRAEDREDVDQRP
ncbi:hypothetical protein PTW37_10100 [Arthrobacter agilis]|uniref:hypothetical protein n=1 Tax=Arthrobacter agilis TaxID=37921 RepID=UPI0023669656|nr:hypothetical protein [Arthrobacter agilis]WDF32226.1 hypothetical protein PTW37_10100 [Arthrobacter agilis]